MPRVEGAVALRPFTSLQLAGLGERCRAIQKRALAKRGPVVWFRVYGLITVYPLWHQPGIGTTHSAGLGAMMLAVIQW